jgi:hypothetical protein
VSFSTTPTPPLRGDPPHKGEGRNKRRSIRDALQLRGA